MQDKENIRNLYNYVQDELDEIIVNSPKYKEISKRYNEKEDLLKKLIGKDEFTIFEDFVDIYTELIGLEAEENFVKGFSLANKYRDESMR